MTAISFLFPFSYQVGESGGLRKVLKRVEGLLRTGSWVTVKISPSPWEAGGSHLEAACFTQCSLISRVFVSHPRILLPRGFRFSRSKELLGEDHT